MGGINYSKLGRVHIIEPTLVETIQGIDNDYYILCNFTLLQLHKAYGL